MSKPAPKQSKMECLWISLKLQKKPV